VGEPSVIRDPLPTGDDGVFRVSAGSDPTSLATAISRTLRTEQEVSARAVGAGAVNQAVKAIAIARGHVASAGKDLICRPGFQTIESHDGQISAIVFRLTTH
jgi:stage V sporulation protein S